MQLNWDHVRIFLAVARHGQFLAAGRSMGLDHATVARRIGVLEESLAVRLLARATTGVSLTPAGERFLVSAESMESAWLAGQGSLAEISEAVAGVVRIGVPDAFGSFFLAPRLGLLADRHPRLTVQLVPLQRAFSLSKREADLAVLIERPAKGERLTTRQLTEFGLSFYASSDYLASRGVPKTLSDLPRHRMVTSVVDLHYSPGLNYYPEAFAPDQPRIECANVAAQVEAVRAGVGIGILHDYHAREDATFVRVLPDHSFRRAYSLVAHEDTRHSARVEAAHRFIVDEVASEARLFA